MKITINFKKDEMKEFGDLLRTFLKIIEMSTEQTKQTEVELAEVSEQAEQVQVELAEVSEQVEQVQTELASEQIEQVESGGISEQLEIIAKDSKSYEDFINKLSMWLELGKQSQLFKALAQAKKVAWDAENRYVLMKAAKKLKQRGFSISCKQLLKLVAAYEPSFYSTDKKSESASTEVGLPCMSEEFNSDVVAEFKSLHSSEEKVKCILAKMGLETETSEVQGLIVAIANVAVKMESEELDWNMIASKANISKESETETLLIFSRFIRNCRDVIKAVKVPEFLQYLKELCK